MSLKPRSTESEFLQAARLFDEELASFHRGVEATLRGPLTGARQLERAAQSLTQVAQAEQRLGLASQTLSRAISQAHEQQMASTQQVNERAQLIAKRTAEFGELMAGYRALGEAAAMLTAELAELARRKKEETAAGAPASSSLVAEVNALSEKLAKVAETAQRLIETARSFDFEDIARQTDSVRQQLIAARNKLANFGASAGANAGANLGKNAPS